MRMITKAFMIIDSPNCLSILLLISFSPIVFEGIAEYPILHLQRWQLLYSLEVDVAFKIRMGRMGRNAGQGKKLYYWSFTVALL